MFLIFGAKMKALEKEANLSIAVPEGFSADDLMNGLREKIEFELPCEIHSSLQYCHSELYVDVIGQVHKSDGVKILSKLTQIPIENTCAFGDGLNDQDIFEFMDRVFCPANAHEKIKSLCKEKSGNISNLEYGDAVLEFYSEIS